MTLLLQLYFVWRGFILFQVEQSTSSSHDTLVLSVQAIELTPQADNPLTRLVVNPELYRKNQNKMELPGSYGLYQFIHE